MTDEDIVAHVRKYGTKEGDPRRLYTHAQLELAIRLASHRRERMADAIETCDWTGCSIGQKAILKAAVLELRGIDAD